METNRYANQNRVAGFQDVELEKMMAFVAINIAMGIVNTSDVKTFGLQTQFFHILGSLQWWAETDSCKFFTTSI